MKKLPAGRDFAESGEFTTGFICRQRSYSDRFAKILFWGGYSDLENGRDARAGAPSSRTSPPGGRSGTTKTIKEADNRGATASPRVGAEGNGFLKSQAF
jgi:hypothetical protein